MDLLTQFRHGLIVSCQAPAGSPLRHPQVMAAMAQAAELGGAVGIRANGVEDIAAIRAVIRLPIIGIAKVAYPGSQVLITPTLADALQVSAAGADLIALDATQRPRPDKLSPHQAIQAYRQACGKPVIADISTLEEGLQAADSGADLVATTLSGYTPYSPQQSAPDLDLIAALAACLSIPIIAEGRFSSPALARQALEQGAFAVVVGTAITALEWVTRQYVEALANG
jgi:putative N-acetylmannosamine-6-phosphate epimerase